MKKIKALVIRTAGTNCDAETLHALKLCGAQTELLHLNELIAAPQKLSQSALMVIPGGFSYGDDIAAGKILANELKIKLGQPLLQFVAEGKLVIGICNGFQVLVKLGLLPGVDNELKQTATLAHNTSGRFQCEWVGMQKENSQAQWLKTMPKNFELPMAHGEGRFVAESPALLKQLEKNKQVVFRYAPRNPNGSSNAIAGLCNSKGNVIGLMPHPERYVAHVQHPAWTRNKNTQDTPGLKFWQCAIQYAKNLN